MLLVNSELKHYGKPAVSWLKVLALPFIIIAVMGMSPLAGDETIQPKVSNTPAEEEAPLAATNKSEDNSSEVDGKKSSGVKLKNEDTYLEFPLDVTEMLDVNFVGKFKRINKYQDETRFVYSVPVTLENVSADDIPGPLRLVILGTGKKGLRIINEDGLISITNEEYTEFHPAGKLFKKNAKSKAQTLIFASKVELKPEEFNTDKMVWRVTREEGETWANILKKKNGKLGDDDKLLAQKDYSRAELRQAMNLQEQFTEMMHSESYAHKDKLVKEIFGTGITEDKAGQPAMVVFVSRLGLEDIFPKQIEGMNVVVQVTEPVRAGPAGVGYKNNPEKINPVKDILDNTDGKTEANPRSKFTRPVPIGVSIANVSQDCYSGTLGCRCTVKGTEQKVILSNNHVIGEENGAIVGEKVNQPSTGDVVPSCTRPAQDEVGQFRQLVPIAFTTTAENLVDAAIANTTAALTDSTTPTDDGYGFPSTEPVDPVIGMRLMKYGRTTGMTRGSVTSINVTISITYDKGLSRFIRQVQYKADTGLFSSGGDSGSLVVTENNKQPVALHYAGGGGNSFGNPIKEVLRLLNITVDGAPTTPPPDPTANGAIGDFVFNDANDNGIQNTGETGIPSVVVRLLQAGADNIIGTLDDVVVKSTISLGDGKYNFENLADGRYYVQFVLPSGRKFAKRNLGGSDELDSDANTINGISDEATITSGNKITNVDCGMLIDTTQSIGRIGNYVWLDTNRDGRQDFTEFGQPGVTVELLDSTEKVLKTTVTNRRGFYIFEQLSPGTYSVRFTIGSGFNFSPANVGNDNRDSDANLETGKTDNFTIEKGRLDFSRDCGVYRIN